MVMRPLPVLIVAVLLAGCGGGGGGPLSKSEYEQKLAAAGKAINDSGRGLAQATTKETFADGVGKVQKALDKAADDLHRVTPPADVETANEKLVGALHGLSDDLDGVADAASESLKQARAATEKLSESAASKQAQDAVTEIERRGYDAGQLGTGG